MQVGLLPHTQVGPLEMVQAELWSSPLRSDCVDILTQCGDKRRFHEGQTAERICELLSPVDDPERCIPLHRYLSESGPPGPPLGTETGPSSLTLVSSRPLT